MVIKINYTSSDVYVSTSVSPVYVVVNYSAVNNGGGGAVWGGITGTLSDQTDLQDALDDKFDDPTGTASQYIRGDGQLANFPDNGGGGSSVNYYLNGSVSQGTFGGTTYYEMSKTPILGAGTNFTRTNAQGNGYIASFITDAGDPSLLNIPSGNWTVEFYFQANSNAGNPQFYAELYKFDASNNFTLVGSGSANPEGITNGTTVDQYYTAIPVPQTSLLVTDRLAIRIYVITSGRTITLHTEDGNLCEVLTTFSTGLNALNGLTAQVQYFATGASGTDFAISSATDTHTFNLPTASGTNRGALSSADWTIFNNKADNNIYTANGTLAGNRVVTLGGRTLTFKEASASSFSSIIVENSGTDSAYLLCAGSSYGISAWQNNSVLASSKSLLFVTNNASASGGSGTFKFSPGGYNVVEQLTIGNGYSTFSSTGSYFLNVNAGTTSTGSFITLTSSGNVNNGQLFSVAPSFSYGTILGKETGLMGFGVLSLRSNDTGYIRFMTGNADPAFSTEKARITSAGRLLLGTTTESTFLLDVNGTARFTDNVSIVRSFNGASALTITNNTTGSSQSLLNLICDVSNTVQLSKLSTGFTGPGPSVGGDFAISNFNVGDIVLQNRVATGKIEFAAGNATTAQATLTAAGRLLLGTTTESTFLLDVNGTARVSGNLTVSNSTIIVNNTATNQITCTGVAGLQFTVNAFCTLSTPVVNMTNANFAVATFSMNGLGTIGGTGRIGNATAASPTGVTWGSGNGCVMLGHGDGRFATPAYVGITMGNQNGVGTQNTSTLFQIGGFGIDFFGDVNSNATFSLVTIRQKVDVTRVGSNLIGFDYNPDIVTMSGNHYAMLIRSGSVGIGTATPNSSSLLDITSTTKGFLPPRLTTTQKNAIGTPAAGLQVYDTTLNQMSYYNGTTWVNF
jgi:hypothetical protein